MRRSVLLLVGIAIGLAGIVLANVPGVLPDDWAPDLVPLVVATLAVLAGLVRARTWFRHEPTETQVGDRERRAAVPVPGDAIDGRIAKAPSVGSTGDTRLLNVRQQLREAAVDVLVRYRGYDADGADEALERGTWTDDTLAAQFFISRTGTGDSVTEVLTSTVYGESPFSKRAGRAAREIYALTRGEEE